MKSAPCACLLTLLLLVESPAPAGAAQVDEKHERSVRLVLVDVKALDDSGGFVADLGKDDFQVFEDGRPVALQSVDLIRRGTVAAAPGDADPPFFVVFDSINTIRRMLDRKRDEIFARLADFVGRGRKVMILELAEDGNMKILQEPTTDPVLVRRAVERAAGSIWVERTADTLSMPGILASRGLEASPHSMALGGDKFERSRRDIYELESRHRFERTTNGLLAAFQVIRTFPGRKPMLLISSGVPSISFVSFFEGSGTSGTAVIQSQVDAAKVRDPFAVLRKKGVESGDEILDSLAAFANSHSISLYALDPDNYLRYVLADMAYDNFPRALPTPSRLSGPGIPRSDQSEEIRKAELATLKSLALDTTGAAFLGGDRFEQFAKIVDADLAEYYELSYAPPRKAPDGRYHEIKVKTNRPGIALRARPGYHDYDENQKASLVLASASAQPGLFREIPFEARIVPFLQGRGRCVMWILMALPTARLLGEGRDLDRPCRLRFQVTVEEKDGGRGAVSDVVLPIVLNPAYLQRIRRASFFGLSLRSGETELGRDAYRVVTALYDLDYGCVGTAESDLAVPADSPDSAAIANIVLGSLVRDEELRASAFSISEKDGRFELAGQAFYPMAVARWNRTQPAGVLLQVRSPERPKDPRPSFALRSASGESTEIGAERAQDGWDKAARAWTAVYRLKIETCAPGPATLVVTWPGETGPGSAREVPLTIF